MRVPARTPQHIHRESIEALWAGPTDCHGLCEASQ